MQRALRVVTTILLLLPVCLVAQQTSSLTGQFLSAPPGFLNGLREKSNQLEFELSNTAKQYLNRLKREEHRLKKKLSRKLDSVTLNSLFNGADSSYDQLIALTGQEQNINPDKPNYYIPLLDTIKTSLNFINGSTLANVSGSSLNNKVTQTLQSINSLQGKLNQSETIRKIIAERKRYLQEQLGNIGFLKELKKFNKDFYYLQETLNNYKNILNDPEKMKSVALRVLQKIPAFNEFFRKHSEIASLFRLPGSATDPIDPASLVGLQTRDMVMQNLERVAGPNLEQLNQSLGSAQAQLSKAKDKIFSQLSKNDQDDFKKTEGFRPNPQKTKSFWDKFELGFNIQNSRSNNFFPVSSDIGLSAGIKPNDKLTAGLGLSGRIGWGTNIQNISITYQGIGLRSFAELHLKSSFHATAGFEMNYRNEIRNIDQLKRFSAWQQSGLIGLTKVISTKSRLFNKTKFSLLWDYLSYQQVPRSKPLLLRFGYAL